jgi:hypothetical protein
MKLTLIATIILAALVSFAPRSEARQPFPRGQTYTETKSETPQWYHSPEWWLVIVAGFTGLFICWQSWESRRAAKAARDNIEILINKERARIDVIPDVVSIDTSDEYLPVFDLKYRIVCTGTTPAIILDSRVAAEISSIRERSEPERWVQIPLPAANVVPGTTDMRADLVGEAQYFSEALEEQIESGRLFVNYWGYVKYRDIFLKGEVFWRKNFRFVYDHRMARFVRSGQPWENSEKKKTPPKNPN